MSNSPAERERKRGFGAEQRFLDQQRRDALKILRDIKRSPQPTSLVAELRQSDNAVLATEVPTPPVGEFSSTRYMEDRGHFTSAARPQLVVTPHRQARQVK